MKHFPITEEHSQEDVSVHEQEPFVLVIFGGTGDLAKRKLIPALYHLCLGNFLKQAFAIVGVSRSVPSDEEFQAIHREATNKFSRSQPIQDSVWEYLEQNITTVQGDVNDPETYKRLKIKLDQLDQERNTKGNRIFYFSTPSKIILPILNNLNEAGLVTKSSSNQECPWTRVIVEKPFGHSYESAKMLNQAALEILNENQIYRIDHYLGKETVQNILVFRFGNSIFEHLWNRKYIDHIQITAAEDIGIDGRGDFYDETGVFRDVIQNHLLEIMTLCTMETPITFQADDIRDQKLNVLRSLQPLYPAGVKNNVVVGQYEGFLEEKGIRPDSNTPTFASMRLFVDNWRWQGVPIYLRAGKKLKRRYTDVAIYFKTIPLCLFGRDDVCEMVDPNILLLRIQPNEGIELRFVCKEPGDNLSIKNVTMDFEYAKGFINPPAEAYERLILDCIRGDVSLFARKDAIEQSWLYLDSVLNSIEQERINMHTYKPGTMGPEASHQLLWKDGKQWRES